jgi:2-isopropylmalate synthase
MIKLQVYDTTLRDGTQREGISLSADDKLKIARKLDEFGIDYIEGGWPGSNPKDVEFFRRAPSLGLEHAKIAAFGSTRRKNVRPEEDANLDLLLQAETPVVTLVGKSWDLHVKDVLRVDLDENLAMIGESVAFIKAHDKEVIFDAEHFFDGYKENPEHALATLLAASENGADMLVLCDTNGGAMPWEVAEIVATLAEQIDTQIGIHTHEDSGCAVANSLVAVRAGAVQVQGTINGYGERVANANLCTIIPDLQIKMGFRCIPEEKLARLTELSRYVAEVANLSHDNHLPYVGASAFAHKGGLHADAMMKNSRSYQHIPPSVVGNQRRTVVSELSGRSTLFDKSQQFGVDANNEQTRKVLTQIKNLESQGFTFEGAEASVELMLHRAHPAYVPPFELIDFMVLVERRRGRGLLAEASVKVRVGPKLMHTVAEGNGPVNALDAALRKALVDVYPQLSSVKLVDYKVRILDSDTGTAATVRVLIDTKDGSRSWSTVGASTNIIEASWRALADSMEYAVLNGKS